MMNIKILLPLILLIFMGGLLKAQNKKPNIILIMADDLGYGDLSSYGSTIIKTPNLDNLASSGIKFTDFHSNGMVCTPTRAALMTGRYQQRTGLSEVVSVRWHHGIGLDQKEITFAEILKKAGYKTALFGKWHLGTEPKYNPIHQGFDEFIGFTGGNVDYFSHLNLNRELDWWHMEKLKDEPGYQTEIITQHAINYIKKADDQPFCLYIPFGAPHTPNQGPYSKVERVPAHLSKEQQKIFRDSINKTIPSPPKGYELAEDSTEQFLQISVEMVEYLDVSIGKIISQLNKSNLLENTIVIFISDNGPRKKLSAGPYRGGKGSLYEGGHRLPCIVSWPAKIKGGITSSETIMTMDFLPTFASIAQAKMPNNLLIDGIDISNHLINCKKLPTRNFYWAKSNGKAVRYGDWKLIENSNKSKELYNLNNDIEESNNIANSNPEIVSKLSDKLNKWYGKVTEGVEQITPHAIIAKEQKKKNQAAKKGAH